MSKSLAPRRRLALAALLALFWLQVFPHSACKSWRGSSPEQGYAGDEGPYQVASTGAAGGGYGYGYDAATTPAPEPSPAPSYQDPSVAEVPRAEEVEARLSADRSAREATTFGAAGASAGPGVVSSSPGSDSKLGGKLGSGGDSGSPGSGSSGGSGGRTGQQQAGAATAKQPAKPMVVYQGYLKMRVRHLRQAVDAAVSIAEKAGGYVESLGKRVVIVRVPASDFERVMDLFATLGNVLDRRTEAFDVTARYRDTLLRLEVAEAAKERLLALLERTTDPAERLRIVREVKRLSEEIEAMASTLATLKNLVDFFTITLELEPVTESQGPQGRTSPFPWVRGLSPHQGSLPRATRAFAFDLPNGFVRFERDQSFRAQAADTTTIRVGEGRNDPVGDSAFWARALDHEMHARDEARVEDGSAGALTYRVYRDKDLAPRYYLVALEATDLRVYVLECFFPNEEAWLLHREAVVKALATFREEA